MLKFLRKYSKVLLVFVGVLLMVAFLLGSVLSQLGRDGLSHTVMTIAGRSISQQEAMEANGQVQVVSRLTSGLVPAGLGIEDRGDHWILAREAARLGGFYGGASSGPQLIRDAAEARFGQAASAEVEKIVEARARVGADYRLGPRETDLALAAARGVMRMQQAFMTAPKVSENRLLRRAKELLEEAEVQVCFVGVDSNVAFIADPSEEQLQAHFDKYKDKRAGEGDSAFGYLRPRRYRLEYLEMDRAGVERAIRVSAVEVAKRVRDPQQAKDQADPDKRRDAIELALRKEAADKVFQEALRAYQSEVLAACNTLPEKDGYRVLPADWAARRPKMAELAVKIVERVKQQTGVDIPPPRVTVRDQAWVGVGELRTLPGLNQIAIRKNRQFLTIDRILAEVKELRKPGDGPREVMIQAGVPYADGLDDFLQNRCFLTVLEAADESPAEALAEVRAQVINDCKRAAEFEKLAGTTARLEALAAAQGFDEMIEQVKQTGGLTADLRSNVRVTRNSVQPQNSPANAKAFMDAMGERMARLDPTVAISTLPPTDQYVAVALPSKLGVAVARLTGFTPLTIERFRQVTAGLERRESGQLVDDRGGLLEHDRLAKQLKLVLPKGVDERKAEQEQAEKAKQVEPIGR